MRNYIFIFVFAIIIMLLSGCQNIEIIYPNDSVPDQTKIEQINYDNYWQYFSDQNNHQWHEVELRAETREQREDDYLRFCGGLWAYGYNLVNENDQTINTLAALAETIKPIDTAEEAMAYVYADNCWLVPSFGEQKQLVRKVDDKWMVSVINYNFIGCGNHAHVRLTFEIDQNGKINLLEDTRLEKGEDFCGD